MNTKKPPQNVWSFFRFIAAVMASQAPRPLPQIPLVRDHSSSPALIASAPLRALVAELCRVAVAATDPAEVQQVRHFALTFDYFTTPEELLAICSDLFAIYSVPLGSFFHSNPDTDTLATPQQPRHRRACWHCCVLSSKATLHSHLPCSPSSHVALLPRPRKCTPPWAPLCAPSQTL